MAWEQRVASGGAVALSVRIRLLALVIVTYVSALASPADAHPHAWIDLRSTVVTDDAGKVSAIEEQWLFDEFYTLFVTEGMDGLAASREASLMELARSNLDNLRAYDYFTEVRVDGSKVELGTVSEYESELRDGRLWMRFVVPLKRPVDAVTSRLTFSVYDPTYYIEMLHLEGDVIAFRGPSVNECSGVIVPPKPTTEEIFLAQALDRRAEPDNSLGRVFAEWIEVTCR